MKPSLYIWLLALLLPLNLVAAANAQSDQSSSKSQRVLTEAAAEQKYTFLIFFRDNGPATKAMLQTVRRALEPHADRAVFTSVNIADSTERPLIERLDVSRAPMPLTVAIAPNGAMTSVTSQKISAEQIEESFVTPGMAHCMKAMQENKLLFVCVQLTDKPVVPPGVEDFCEDPEFKERTAVMVVQKNDPLEVSLLEQLEVDLKIKGTTVVLLAPPAAVVGKFPFDATKDQMAAALHEAGHCCDDPNCKHNHNKASKTSTSRMTGRQKTSGNRRKP